MTRSNLLIFIIAACVALATLGITWARGPGGGTSENGTLAGERPVVCRWLQLDADASRKVQEADPDYQAQVQALREQAEAAQRRLAELLDAGADDAAIRQQLEVSLLAQATVERRVLDYVLAIRPQLTTPQQKRLLDITAQGVRQGGQHRRRYGAGGSGGADSDATPGPGGGGGHGRGRD